MKRYIFPIMLFMWTSFAQSTFAMNSEFQKPDEVLEDDVYATPAAEDTGEVIHEPAQPVTGVEQAPAAEDATMSAPATSSTVEPVPTSTTKIEPVTETIEQSTTNVNTVEQQPTNADETNETVEQMPTNNTTDIVPLTSPSSGESSDVVIEQATNIWLFVIAGGVILIVMITLLFQRLRKNNSYSR